MAKKRTNKQVEGGKHNLLSRLSFGTTAALASGLLLLSCVSLFVNPAKAWFFTIFGLLYLPFALLVLVLLIWAIIRRSRTAGLLFLALIPSFFLTGRYFQFSAPSGLPEPTLRVVSYNVGLFTHPKDGTTGRMALADSVCAYLGRLDADVICLQEFYLPNGQSTAEYLQQKFPLYRAEYYVLTGSSGHAGNVTLSRKPVRGKGKIDFDRSTNLALYTDIALDSSVVRFYNCHFESYNISPSRVVKGAGDDALMEETGRKMRRSIRERPIQVEEVLRNVEQAPVQSAVLGDFNDNPLSYTCFRLLRGRRDSFVRAGRGFGATYRTLWPLLRIDYILYPPCMDAVSYTVDRKAPYSDHYPVICTYYETGRNLR